MRVTLECEWEGRVLRATKRCQTLGGVSPHGDRWLWWILHPEAGGEVATEAEARAAVEKELGVEL